MRDAESQAAFIVCPMCDEIGCVGRYVCKQIADYIKAKKEKERKMNDADD